MQRDDAHGGSQRVILDAHLSKDFGFPRLCSAGTVPRDVRLQMGGLQEATRWRGPMLTDSGGYQIFSMGHGSVGEEIKGRRGRGTEGEAEFGESAL